jgi:hypothetical protein
MLPNRSIRTDHQSGEITCSIAIVILDMIPEGGPYTRAQDTRKPGAPNSLAHHDMGLCAVWV